jgi:hypothetical protein
MFRADGQTDMTKLAVHFRNFANAPKTAAFASIEDSCFSRNIRHA